jgi:hypothetical protein
LFRLRRLVQFCLSGRHDRAAAGQKANNTQIEALPCDGGAPG